MKYLKIALVLLGTLLLLFSCTNTRMKNTQPSGMPTDFYVKHNCWESPFDPHEILDSWPVIKTKMMDNYMALIMVGNPKIDWEYKLEMDIPEGDLTLAVVFAFVELPTGVVELFSFGYVDKDSTFYIYAWNIQQNCYTLYKTGIEKKKNIISI